MNDENFYDTRFLAMVAMPEVRLVDVTGTAAESQRRAVRHIASTLFCSADIDPSIVAFAKYRIAAHWGLTEEEVDLRVTRRLLQKTASLITELVWLAEDPIGAGREDVPADAAA